MPAGVRVHREEEEEEEVRPGRSYDTLKGGGRRQGGGYEGNRASEVSHLPLNRSPNSPQEVDRAGFEK
ncbi:hypothetical protein NQZ68_032710 [Dissostichus eleginoides]|nr:hypothetical protein NQZ68_032710 [Dissostichus eleginoides]